MSIYLFGKWDTVSVIAQGETECIANVIKIKYGFIVFGNIHRRKADTLFDSSVGDRIFQVFINSISEISFAHNDDINNASPFGVWSKPASKHEDKAKPKTKEVR